MGSGQGLGAFGLSHPVSHSSAISPLSAGLWVIYWSAHNCSLPQEVRLPRQLLGALGCWCWPHGMWIAACPTWCPLHLNEPLGLPSALHGVSLSPGGVP